jgi:hypothetical protein
MGGGVLTNIGLLRIIFAGVNGLRSVIHRMPILKPQEPAS